MERHSLQRPYPQKRLRQLLHCHSKATLKLPNIIPKWNGEWIGIAPHVINGSSTGHPMSWFHQHVLLNTHHGFHSSALLIWIDQGQADGRICCCQCSTRAPGASTQIRHTKIFQRWQSIDQLTYNNWSKSFRQWGQWGWLHLQDVCSYAYMYILLFYLCVCVCIIYNMSIRYLLAKMASTCWISSSFQIPSCHYPTKTIPEFQRKHISFYVFRDDYILKLMCNPSGWEWNASWSGMPPKCHAIFLSILDALAGYLSLR